MTDQPKPNPLDQLLTMDFWHGVVYGNSGVGKSHFLATVAEIPSMLPVNVWMFDGIGKQRPYLKRGHGKPEVILTQKGKIPTELVRDKDGNLIFAIEHYRDIDVARSNCFAIFLNRLAQVRNDPTKFKTYFLDSFTYASRRGRKLHQYNLNPQAENPMQWYGGEADFAEDVLTMQLPAIPAHMGVAMHVGRVLEELDGDVVPTKVKAPWVPGKRLKGATTQSFAEVYRLYVDRDAEGNRTRLLQTETDDQWSAMTQLDLPDPCPARFTDVWHPVEA